MECSEHSKTRNLPFIFQIGYVNKPNKKISNWVLQEKNAVGGVLFKTIEIFSRTNEITTVVALVKF
jgi:hypothetical protein